MKKLATLLLTLLLAGGILAPVAGSVKHPFSRPVADNPQPPQPPNFVADNPQPPQPPNLVADNPQPPQPPNLVADNPQPPQPPNVAV